MTRPWTIRARPDLDEIIRQRKQYNLSARMMTLIFTRQIVEKHAHLTKVMHVLEYMPTLINALDQWGVEWRRVYKRQLKFQPLFSDDGGDAFLEDWFIAKFDHKAFNKRGGIVFEREIDKKIIAQFGSFDDAQRFLEDPLATFKPFSSWGHRPA